MPYRPLALIVLGVLHILEPVGKILYYKIFLSHLSDNLISNIFKLPFWELFTWLALFPIAGIAILAVKNWSLPVFLAVEAYVLASNYSVFKLMYLNGHFIDLAVLLGFTLLNILVVSFILVPAVRIYYTDPKLRWWEAHPRYNVKLECELEGFGESHIHDMSKSGVFVSNIDGGPSVGDIVPIKFTENDDEYKLNGKVIAFFKKGDIDGIGIQFFANSRDKVKDIKKLIKKWERSGVNRRPKRRDYLSELKNLPVKFMKPIKDLVSQLGKDES